MDDYTHMPEEQQFYTYKNHAGFLHRNCYTETVIHCGCSHADILYPTTGSHFSIGSTFLRFNVSAVGMGQSSANYSLIISPNTSSANNMYLC